MRTTTELTARFALTSTLIGEKEITEFWATNDLVYDEESDNLIRQSPSYELISAEEDEELRYLDGYAGRIDALDFATVPFETVEADLAEELYEMDEAEDREREDHVCCAKCGREENGWDESFTYVAYQYLCPCCEPKSREERLAFRELNLARAMRTWEKKLAAANQFREAVRKAKFLRPDLNWERFDNDARGYAGPRPFFGWI